MATNDGDSSTASAVALTGDPERPKRYSRSAYIQMCHSSALARNETKRGDYSPITSISALSGSRKNTETSCAAPDFQSRGARMAHEAKLGRESRRAQHAAAGAARLSVDGFTQRQRHQARAGQRGFATDREDRPHRDRLPYAATI